MQLREGEFEKSSSLPSQTVYMTEIIVKSLKIDIDIVYIMCRVIYAEIINIMNILVCRKQSVKIVIINTVFPYFQGSVKQSLTFGIAYFFYGTVQCIRDRSIYGEAAFIICYRIFIFITATKCKNKTSLYGDGMLFMQSTGLL